jgi:hypothetical protein
MNLSTLKRPAVITSVLVLGISAISFGFGLKAAGVYLRKLPIYPADNRPVRKIPTESVNWKAVGPDRREKQEVEEVLGTENYVSRAYARKSESGVDMSTFLDVHIAYYTGQIDTVPHVPDRCFVGAGMNLVRADVVLPLALSRQGWVEDTSVPPFLKGKIFLGLTSNNSNWTDAYGMRVRLPVDMGNAKLRISEYRDKHDRRIFAGYFFIANGSAVSSAEEVRLKSFDLRADYAYYCKVQFTSTQVANPEELARLASEFLNDFAPEISRCVPDWVEVETGRFPPDNPRRTPPS